MKTTTTNFFLKNNNAEKENISKSKLEPKNFVFVTHKIEGKRN